MVFENLTLFEIRLEDAQFGPRSLGGDDSSDEEPVTAEAAGRGRRGPLFVLALVTIGLAALWRRSRVDDDVDFAIEDDAELATAQ